MNREHKIWDNGNKVTIIKSYEEGWDNFDYEYIVGDAPIGILGCNLRDYTLEHNNGNMKNENDVFVWVMTEKKINSFDFTVADLMESYGYDSYTDCETSEDVCIDVNKEYSVEEQKDIIMDMFYNDCLDAGMIFNILNQTKFDRFIIRPFYAYIHSGISVSLGDFRDPWDSGMAGLTWYEPYEDETMENAEKCFREYFDTYDDYIQGYYNEYHLQTFEKVDGEWKSYDDYWDVAKSFEDVWENYDYRITDPVDHFSEADKDLVRQEIFIGDDEVLDFLENLD